MAAADPSYPFFPIASILAAFLLLLVLLTSFIRQNWNLGVTFLCFWIFLENIADAVKAIIWSDNADIKHYVFCDIVTHLDMITYVVKPMATLIITRRLYLIASLQFLELPGQSARRWNSFVEWTLGLFVPLLVAGPIYYVHQGVRFQVDEVFGCTDTAEPSILQLLTAESWALVPPLVSVLYYYPKVIRTFYRQSRDIHSFLNSNSSVSRTNYLRILALASVDILLTLPFGIVNVVLKVTSTIAQGQFPFYWGWTLLHTDWKPNLFIRWTSPVLAFTIFGLFGATSEARTSYWHIVCIVGGWFGWKPTPHTENRCASLGEINFGARPQDMSLGDIEMGPGSRRPSFVTPGAPATNRGVECTPGNAQHESVSDSINQVRSTASNNGEAAGAAVDV